MAAVIEDLAEQALTSFAMCLLTGAWPRTGNGNAVRRLGRGSVLLHLTQTDELAIPSARGDLDSFSEGILGPRSATRVTVDARRRGSCAIRTRHGRGSHRLSVARLATTFPARASKRRPPPNGHMGFRPVFPPHLGHHAFGRGLDPRRRHRSGAGPRRCPDGSPSPYCPAGRGGPSPMRSQRPTYPDERTSGPEPCGTKWGALAVCARSTTC